MTCLLHEPSPVVWLSKPFLTEDGQTQQLFCPPKKLLQSDFGVAPYSKCVRKLVRKDFAT
jgi:hypothetical protein